MNKVLLWDKVPLGDLHNNMGLMRSTSKSIHTPGQPDRAEGMPTSLVTEQHHITRVGEMRTPLAFIPPEESA